MGLLREGLQVDVPLGERLSFHPCVYCLSAQMAAQEVGPLCFAPRGACKVHTALGPGQPGNDTGTDQLPGHHLPDHLQSRPGSQGPSEEWQASRQGQAHAGQPRPGSEVQQPPPHGTMEATAAGLAAFCQEAGVGGPPATLLTPAACCRPWPAPPSLSGV